MTEEKEDDDDDEDEASEEEEKEKKKNSRGQKKATDSAGNYFVTAYNKRREERAKAEEERKKADKSSSRVANGTAAKSSSKMDDEADEEEVRMLEELRKRAEERRKKMEDQRRTPRPRRRQDRRERKESGSPPKEKEERTKDRRRRDDRSEEKDESKAQRIRGRGMVSAQHVQDRPMQKYVRSEHVWQRGRQEERRRDDRRRGREDRSEERRDRKESGRRDRKELRMSSGAKRTQEGEVKNERGPAPPRRSRAGPTRRPLRGSPGQRSKPTQGPLGSLQGSSFPPAAKEKISPIALAFLQLLHPVLGASGLHTVARCAAVCRNAKEAVLKADVWDSHVLRARRWWALPPVPQRLQPKQPNPAGWRPFLSTLRPRCDGIYVGECGFQRWLRVGHHSDLRKNSAQLAAYGGRGGQAEWVSYRRYVRLMPPDGEGRQYAMVLQDPCPREAAEQVLVDGVDFTTHCNPVKSEGLPDTQVAHVCDAERLRKRLCVDWKGGGLEDEGKDHFPSMNFRPKTSLEHLA
eukprot:g123.t1